MSKVLCGGINTVSVAAGVTNYLHIGMGSLGAQTTEVQAQRTMRKAGKFSRLYVHVSANTLSSTCAVSLRIGGVDTALLMSIGAGLTGRFTLIGEVNTSVADLVSFGVVAAAGTGSITLIAVLLDFDAGGTSATTLLGADASSTMTTTASATRFLPPCAAIQTGITTEANAAPQIDIAGTFRNLQCYVSANTRTTTSTLQFRKNSGNGNQVISIGAGVTGFFEDTTHTDVVVATDTFCVEHINGLGVGAITYTMVSCEFDSSVARKYQLYGYQASAVSSVARPASIIGTASGGTTTGQPLGFEAKVTNLRTYITQNSRDLTETITTLYTGTPQGSSALSLTFGATLTGQFSDTTHVDFVHNNDQYEINRGAADNVGTYTTSWFALTVEHYIPFATIPVAA